MCLPPRTPAVVHLVLLAGLATIHPAAAQVPSTWKRIGPAGAYRNTLGINGMNGRFYTIENDGTLYSSDLTGAWKQIGKTGDYAGTTMILAMDGRFYNIQNGTMYATDPSDGSWVTIAAPGSWANTAILVGMNGYIWSFERDGTLYRTDRNGSYEKIDAGHLRPRMLAAMSGKLWAIDDATLWSLDPGKRWEMLGDPGDFEDASWFIASPGFLWELDDDGTLFRGDSNYKWIKVGGDGEFKGVRFLVALGTNMYVIKDGTMYRVPSP